MDNGFSKLKTKFKKSTDREKVTILTDLKNVREKYVSDFLLDVVQKEPFYKIRILAALQLKNFDEKLIGERLEQLYHREKDESVQIAIIETLSSFSSFERKSFLISQVKKGRSGMIKGTALRKIHEKNLLEHSEMEKVLLDLIKNEKESFPLTLALGLIRLYSSKESLSILKNFSNTVEEEEIKQLVEETVEFLKSKYY